MKRVSLFLLSLGMLGEAAHADVISRTENGSKILMYLKGEYVYRRMCPKEDPTPTSSCDQVDPSTKMDLPAMLILDKKDYLAAVAKSFGVNDSTVFNNRGQDELKAEIAELEEFLKDPTISEEDRKATREKLQKLKSSQGGVGRLDTLVADLFDKTKKKIMPNFSEDFKKLAGPFLKPDKDVIILFDREQNLFWRYLGHIRGADASDEPRDSGHPNNFHRTVDPLLPGCSRRFGWRLPTRNEWDYLRRPNLSFGDFRTVFDFEKTFHKKTWTDTGDYEFGNDYYNKNYGFQWKIDRLDFFHTMCVTTAPRGTHPIPQPIEAETEKPGAYGQSQTRSSNHCTYKEEGGYCVIRKDGGKNQCISLGNGTYSSCSKDSLLSGKSRDTISQYCGSICTSELFPAN